MAHDVFISHSSKDKTTADAVCATLESEGVRCWIAPRDVTPGEQYGKCIIEAIKGSRVMVLVFTSNANASPQIEREVERAVNHDVAILPFRVENVMPDETLEYFIGSVHWLDAMTPPLEAHLHDLARTVKLLIAPAGPQELNVPTAGARALSVAATLDPRAAIAGGGQEQSGGSAVKQALPGEKSPEKQARNARSGPAKASSGLRRTTLALLSVMFIFSWGYITVLASTIGRIAQELHLPSAKIPQLFTVLAACNILAGPLAGWAGDKVRRKPIIVGAAALMSLGTLATAGAQSALSLLLCQSAVFAAAMTFGVLTVSLLSDAYSERKRVWVFAIFFIMASVGAAIGTVAWGPIIAGRDWRNPMVLFSIPGMLLAALYGLLGDEPARGSCDSIAPDRRRATFAGLFSNSAFLAAGLGLAAITCAFTALEEWAAYFLIQVGGIARTTANLEASIVLLVAGVIGNPVGGWLAEQRLRTTDRALYQISFLSVALAVPFFAMFLFGNSGLAIPLLFAAELFLLLSQPSIIAAVVNSVSAPVRARAMGISQASAQFFALLFVWGFMAWEGGTSGPRLGLAATLVIVAIAAVILFIGARFAPSLGNPPESEAESLTKLSA